MWYFGAHRFRLTEQMHECERVDLLWVLCPEVILSQAYMARMLDTNQILDS